MARAIKYMVAVMLGCQRTLSRLPDQLTTASSAWGTRSRSRSTVSASSHTTAARVSPAPTFRAVCFSSSRQQAARGNSSRYRLSISPGP